LSAQARRLPRNGKPRLSTDRHFNRVNLILVGSGRAGQAWNFGDNGLLCALVDPRDYAKAMLGIHELLDVTIAVEFRMDVSTLDPEVSGHPGVDGVARCFPRATSRTFE